MRILSGAAAVMMLSSACFLSKPGLASHGSPPQHSIRVMLLDADSNKPRWRVHTALRPANSDVVFNRVTNRKGTVAFQLPSALPEQLVLIFAPDDFYLCSNAVFRSDDVLKKGIIGTDPCKKSGPKYSGKPVPGELIVFGKKVNPWQRLLQEIP